MLSSSSPRDISSSASKDDETKACDNLVPKITAFQNKAVVSLKFHLSSYGVVSPTLLKSGLYRITFPKMKLMHPLYCDIEKNEIIYPISREAGFKTSVE